MLRSSLCSRSLLGLILGAAVLGPAAPAAAQEAEPPVVQPEVVTRRPVARPVMHGGQVERGFALEAFLGTQFLDILGGSFSDIQGGFFAGYKLNRIIVGGGFEVSRTATDTTTLNQVREDSTTSWLVTPGVRVAILRSPDLRVEMFGQFDIGLGTIDQNPEAYSDTFHLIYQIGPGVRFWVHPHFALAGLFGLRGDFYFTDTSANSDESTGLTSIFSRIVLLGVF